MTKVKKILIMIVLIFILLFSLFKLFFIKKEPFSSYYCLNKLINPGNNVFGFYDYISLPVRSEFNPIKFNNTKNYLDFQKFQKEKGLNCNILDLKDEDLNSALNNLHLNPDYEDIINLKKLPNNLYRRRFRDENDISLESGNTMSLLPSKLLINN